MNEKFLINRYTTEEHADSLCEGCAINSGDPDTIAEFATEAEATAALANYPTYIRDMPEYGMHRTIYRIEEYAVDRYTYNDDLEEFEPEGDALAVSQPMPQDFEPDAFTAEHKHLAYPAGRDASNASWFLSAEYDGMESADE